MNVPPRIARRKTRVLRAELQMLQKYKTEASLLLDEYRQEYASDMIFLEEKLLVIDEELPEQSVEENVVSLDSEHVDHREKTEEFSPEEDIPEEKSKAEIPGWAKKLYRKIALISHPDRMSEAFPKEKLKKIFLETSNAMNEGDFEKLLGFALELGIEEQEDDVSMLPLLSKRVGDVKKEIQDIESSPEWLWGEGFGIPEIRIGLARLFFARKGVNLNTEDLTAIIQEMENRSDQPPD